MSSASTDSGLHRRRRRIDPLTLLVVLIALLCVAAGVTVWVRAGTADPAAAANGPDQSVAVPGHSGSAQAPDEAYQPAILPDTVDPSKWTQTGGDEFNGSKIDNTKWIQYTGTNDSTGENWTPSLCSESGGMLTLQGVAGPDGKLCGMAWLKDQTYGRWIIRARMLKPANPQFALVSLLWPENDSSWPAAGEVDYAEEYDPNRAYIQGWLHYGKHDSQLYTGRIPVDTSQWHTYGVEWEPGHVSFFIDNVVTWETTETRAIPTGPMHQTLQLNLNREYKEVDVPSVMQVDWLHIYAP